MGEEDKVICDEMSEGAINVVNGGGGSISGVTELEVEVGLRVVVEMVMQAKVEAHTIG